MRQCFKWNLVKSQIILFNFFSLSATKILKAQVRHGSCWGDPQCICAIAARSGLDVFIIDFCHEREFIDFPRCDDHSLQVLRDEDLTYRVTYIYNMSLKS